MVDTEYYWVRTGISPGFLELPGPHAGANSSLDRQGPESCPGTSPESLRAFRRLGPGLGGVLVLRRLVRLCRWLPGPALFLILFLFLFFLSFSFARTPVTSFSLNVAPAISPLVGHRRKSTGSPGSAGAPPLSARVVVVRVVSSCVRCRSRWSL